MFHGSEHGFFKLKIRTNLMPLYKPSVTLPLSLPPTLDWDLTPAWQPASITLQEGPAQESLLPPHPPIPRPSGSPALSSWFSTCSSFWPAVCLTRCHVWRSGPLSPSIPSSPSPSVSTSSFSTSACLVLSCVWVNQSHFPSFQIWVGISLVYYTFHCQKLGIFMSSP